MSKIILDLCGGTGAWSKPYKDAGYDVRVITLPEFNVSKAIFLDEFICFPCADNSPEDKVSGAWVKIKDVHGILAAPPCTMFSMARTVAKTPRDLRGAMETVNACLRIIHECQYGGKRLAFWAMENPKARLRWFMGKPAMTFSPHEFGDAYHKPTDLWGNFNTDLKRTKVSMTKEQMDRAHENTQFLEPIPTNYVRDPNMSTRAIARSITHPGFAEAFFRANP